MGPPGPSQASRQARPMLCTQRITARGAGCERRSGDIAAVLRGHGDQAKGPTLSRLAGLQGHAGQA